MDTFIRFLYEFMSVFFNGLLTIFKGIASGFIQMFNFSEYLYIIQFYKNEFEVSIVLILVGISKICVKSW